MPLNAQPTSLTLSVVGRPKALDINMAKDTAFPSCMGGWRGLFNKRLRSPLHRRKLLFQLSLLCQSFWATKAKLRAFVGAPGIELYGSVFSSILIEPDLSLASM